MDTINPAELSPPPPQPPTPPTTPTSPTPTLQPPSPTPTSTLLTPTRTPTPTPPTNTHTITTNTPTPPTTPTSPPPPTPTPPPPPPSPGMSTRSAPDRGADQGADQSPIRDRPVTGWHPEPLATTAEQAAMNQNERQRTAKHGVTLGSLLVLLKGTCPLSVPGPWRIDCVL